MLKLRRNPITLTARRPSNFSVVRSLMRGFQNRLGNFIAFLVPKILFHLVLMQLPLFVNNFWNKRKPRNVTNRTFTSNTLSVFVCVLVQIRFLYEIWSDVTYRKICVIVRAFTKTLVALYGIYELHCGYKKKLRKIV